MSDAEEMNQLLEQLTSHLKSAWNLQERNLPQYQELSWPSWGLPLMKMRTHAYSVSDYGNVFTMSTCAMGGMMNLATVVCTPNQGGRVPLLLIDAMKMRQKRALFVEYYDCTQAGVDSPELQSTAMKYQELPPYAEKPAWYVGERMPESLIKGGSEDARLQQMALDSIDAYARLGSRCRPDADAALNQAGLGRFIGRMEKEGNPASASLNRVLGKQQAEIFFRTAVMPAVYQSIREDENR